MNPLTVHPSLRWAAPVTAAVLVVGGGAAVTRIASASADGARSSLPARSAVQLLSDVHGAHVDGLSGTLVESADLGLPSLPSGGGGSAELSSLVSGSHTMRVWTTGSDRSRLAVLGSTGESDVVRNGQDVWIWSSSKHSAQHLTLPKGRTAKAPASAASTPQELAQQLLTDLAPTTSVTSGATTTVAGRAAYELVVSPRQQGTLVKSIRVAIDAKTHLPLRIRVFSTQLTKPAFELGFTSLSIGRPDSSRFAFNPPPGTKVTQVTPPVEHDKTGALPQQLSALVKDATPKVVGKGWTSVLTATLPNKAVNGMPSAGSARSDQKSSGADPSGSGMASGSAGDASSMKQLLGVLPQVHGSWGSGRLLKGTLFSALITDDGRVLIGAVTPETLYAAAGR